MYKKIGLMCLLILVCQHANCKERLDSLAATVNDIAIVESQLDAYVKFLVSKEQRDGKPVPENIKSQVLAKVIDDKIQVQLAQQAGMRISDAIVNDAIADYLERRKISIDELQEELQEDNITLEQHRDFVREALLVTQLQERAIARDVIVSEQEVADLLLSPMMRNQLGEEYRLAHILLLPKNNEALDDVMLRADELVDKLNSGTDFNKVAMQESKGQQALAGGDLGWRALSQLPTLFVNYATSMQEGEISKPIRASNGVHIIKLIEKRQQDDFTEEVKLQHILITPGEHLSHQAARDKLTNIRSAILKGEDFAQLAKQHSQESATASAGGIIDWVSPEALTKDFNQHIQNLASGQLSEIFETSQGFHCVKVLDKRQISNSQAMLAQKAKSILYEKKKMEMLQLWLESMKENARIEILNKNYKI